MRGRRLNRLTNEPYSHILQRCLTNVNTFFKKILNVFESQAVNDNFILPIQECLGILAARLAPTTDTDLLLATCRGGSHFTFDIQKLPFLRELFVYESQKTPSPMAYFTIIPVFLSLKIATSIRKITPRINCCNWVGIISITRPLESTL